MKLKTILSCFGILIICCGRQVLLDANHRVLSLYFHDWVCHPFWDAMLRPVNCYPETILQREETSESQFESCFFSSLMANKKS